MNGSTLGAARQLSAESSLYTRYPIVARRARPSASREQMYLAYKNQACYRNISEHIKMDVLSVDV